MPLNGAERAGIFSQKQEDLAASLPAPFTL